MSMKCYEVLWYENAHDDSVDALVYTKEFVTKAAALRFYRKHKNDAGKRDWWITKRDYDWSVIESIDLNETAYEK